MPGPSEIERRYVGRIQALTGAADRKLRGYAIVFESLSVDLGGFREIIAPSAVDRTLKNNLEVRALVDHETRLVLGNTHAGTLQLRKDRSGLLALVDPPDTTYANDLMKVIDRGDVNGMSFRFRIMPDGQQWDEDADGQLIRTITDMTVDEVSFVTFPAYPDTTAAVRSLRDFRQQTARDAKYYRMRMAR